MSISTLAMRSVLAVLAIWGLPAAAAQQSRGQASATGVSQVARSQQAVEDWVLANPHLRVVVRPDNLTLSVEDLDSRETWGADPWENSAGRIHLRSKNNETLAVNLGAAAQKKIESLAASGRQEGVGLQSSLSRFRSRLGPVREDRGVDDHLSLELQIRLAAELARS